MALEPNMTIRKKILLFSALALGAFLAAVFLLSRFALLHGFSRLEKNYARDSVYHLQNELDNEKSRLELMARDYAQWDRTYEFMARENPEYIRTELTDDTFKIIRIGFFALLDNSGRVVFQKSVGELKVDEDGLRAIAAVQDSPRKTSRGTPGLNGTLEMRGRLILLSYQPILTSRGNGTPRGTLVMGRELTRDFISSLSQRMGTPLWLQTPNPELDSKPTIWSDGSNSVRMEDGNNLLECLPIKDFSGSTRRLLVSRIPRELYAEGSSVMRYLLALLTIAGAIYCGALFFFLEEILLARVASLSTKVTQVTVSGDLSLRLNPGGSDELSALAGAVNAMLGAIQKAKGELLQAQESLRFHAEHDGLTGVLNRRAIRDVLRRELARCRRERNTLGVILADVDHFKKINDHFGHGGGDAVLVSVVQRISATLRPYDVIGRYGGEEFLIIAPGCDLVLAQKLAERVRMAVHDEAIDLGNECARVTLSLGVTLGTSKSDPEFLVALADTAMYQAKRNGRDRVEVGTELSTHEVLEEPVSVT